MWGHVPNNQRSRLKVGLYYGVLFDLIWCARVCSRRSQTQSGVRLYVRKFRAFRSRSAHWTIWPKSRVDLSVLTYQQQSSTQANWLASSRHKWENSSLINLLTLAELVRLLLSRVLVTGTVLLATIELRFFPPSVYWHRPYLTGVERSQTQLFCLVYGQLPQWQTFY
jgi:hypothetical protein